MAVNLSTLYNSDSLYEQLIRQVVAVESQPQLALKAKRSDQEILKGVLSDFSSKVSALHTKLDALSDPLRKTFAARQGTAEGLPGLSVSASDEAAVGEHTLRVDRLARADTRVSKQFAAAGTELATFFAGPEPGTIGSRPFTVQIAQPDGASVDLVVDYAPAAGESDEAILGGIAQAVNDAVAAAEAEGTLAAGTGAQASVVRETDGTARLSLRSQSTGFGNRLAFSDPSGLLALLEVDRTDVRAGTGGGAVYAVGTDAASSSLSSALTVDGLTLYRDTNTIDDALDGVKLTLTKAGSEEGTVRIGSDVKGMRSQVEGFIKAYNEVVSFLAARTKVDPDAKTRGTFAGDASISGIRYGMRADLARAVTPLNGGPDTLDDLGIEVKRDGTLSLADGGKLDALLESNPSAVDHLFSSGDGLASRLAARIDPLRGTDGVIASRKDIADGRISQLTSRIQRWDQRLTAREDSLRAQFTRLQEVMAQMQSQQSSLLSYTYV